MSIVKNVSIRLRIAKVVSLAISTSETATILSAPARRTFAAVFKLTPPIAYHGNVGESVETVFTSSKPTGILPGFVFVE